VSPSEEAPPPEPAGPPAEVPLELLDGAVPDPDSLASEPDELRARAGDASLPIGVRLEAFGDIADAEVGDTAFVRARNLEREFGLRQLYLKFEGGNPTGTQKDRIAFAQVEDALRRGYGTVTVASCGNYGAAVALACSLAGLRCLVYIPEGYRTRRLEEVRGYGAEIVRVPGDYETSVRTSSERAGAEELYDANPGGANTALQLRAYGEIAREVFDELRDAPAAVALPVSNGTTLAGVHRGFASLYRRGKTSRMPPIVAGSASRRNPIVSSFLKDLPTCTDLDPASVRETEVSEPLINWHSSDGNAALQAVRATSGWAGDASDREMLSYARLLREREGLQVLPASTAGLAVLIDRHRREPLPADRYVAVLTGRRP